MSRFFKAYEKILDASVLVFGVKNTQRLAKISSSFLYKTYLSKSYHTDTTSIQFALGYSKDHAKKTAVDSFFNLIEFLVDYQAMTLPTFDTSSRLHQIDITTIDILHHILESNRPILVTSIHMSSFMVGILALCQHLPKDRHVVIVKMNKERKKETNSYQKFTALGASISFLRLNEKPAIEMLSTLKKGQIVFVMCDVAPQFGKTTEVNFMGKRSQFHCGPIELAIAAKAIVLPLVVMKMTRTSTPKYNVILEKPIYPELFNTLSFQEKTIQLTQNLASTVEQWIKTSPSQWHSWGILPLLWRQS